MFSQAYASTLPLTGSDIASQWDDLYWFLVAISVFFFILVVGGMIVYLRKYRASAHSRPKYITGSHSLEAIFVVVPTVLLLMIFGWGYVVYHRMTQAPLDAYEIKVIGKQWLWQFQYDNGKTTVNEFFAPVNRPVKLVMTSEDVLHSFFIPNFRIKQDVVPGMYTSVWFEAKVTGKHQVYCTEYCGTSHSAMLAKAVILDEAQWNDWLKGKDLGPIPEAGKELTAAEISAGKTVQAQAAPVIAPAVQAAERGKRVAETKGCIACHTSDGTVKVGPSWKGLFNSQVELSDGSKVRADLNYLIESIEEPQVRVVRGFETVPMPAFKGLVSSHEMNDIVAYIKSVP